ncbi:MAG: pyrroline-5-carboxylate reductase [Actinobacteria bacterium]|nr:pyrroline-5-carboxylate reductase [Actinomycetota bacterium]
MSVKRIGLIGAGNMGSAMVRGWLKADPGMVERITVTDAVPSSAKRLAKETGVAVASSNLELVENSDLVMIAVKPPDIEHALEGTLEQFGRGKILVSVAAGRTIISLETIFPVEVAVFRLMPNVAVEVNAGTICFATGSNVDPQTEEEVFELFRPLGRVIVLQEKLFAAATAIGGSGPGFMALFADAFIDGGVMAGLPVPIARELTVTMLHGTAKLLMEKGMLPSELRHMVTSPAGTTASGIAQLERDGARSAIIDAVQVAAGRATELG